jgi:hypothetical protein
MEKILGKIVFIFMMNAILWAVPALATDGKLESDKEEAVKEETVKDETSAKTEEEAPAEEKRVANPALHPMTYSPDYCEFTVGFPDEPLIENVCENGNPDRCFDQVSFIHTFDLQATVSFRVICNKIDKEVYKHYSAAVMEATLKEMTKKTTVQTFDTSYREEKGYKQAGLVGEGKMGRSSTIYLGQLWIGSQSAMSVEAEIVGDPNHDADLLFSNVLKSVKYIGDEKKAVTNEANDKKDGKSEKDEKKKD